MSTPYLIVHEKTLHKGNNLITAHKDKSYIFDLNRFSKGAKEQKKPRTLYLLL